MDTEIHQITDQSELYPPLLREINDPPKELFYRGNIALLQEPKLLAVVGSRKSTGYGRQCIEKLLPKVIESGVIIVSGLAYGIDSLAHEACVKLGRPTVAVLGSGIDEQSIYPRNHISLAHRILDNDGVLISEYPPGTPSYPGNFPMRNRIIAGLCQATLIVQATDRSGSLITARLALESNRDVWAVPGNITDASAFGTNKLIQNGAAPITSADDILYMYGISAEKTVASSTPDDLTQDELTVWEVLSNEPKHVDEVVIETKIDIPVVSATLVQLELRNLAQHVGGMRYARKILQ